MATAQINRQDALTEATYYGNLAKVALGFYLSTGNPAELTAVFVYSRYAARAAKAVR